MAGIKTTIRTLLPLTLSFVLLLVAVSAQVSQPTFAVTLRNATFDAYQRWHPREYRTEPVRIVDVDEESLARHGQWPWPRTRLATLVDALRALGAKVVAFDVLFPEPDRTSPAVVAEEWTRDPRVLAVIRELPDHDRVFADAVGRGGVVTGFALSGAAGGRVPAAKAGFVLAGDDPRQFLRVFAGAAVTLPEIEAAAAGNGALNFIPGSDGVVRSVPLLFRRGDELHPSLMVEALRLSEEAGSYLIKSSGASGQSRYGAKTGILSVRVGRFEIPTDSAGHLWLHYTPRNPRRSIPAWKILDGAVASHELAGAIVFIGTSAAGLKDLRFTSLGSIAGVEVHAQAVEQVLEGTYLLRPDWATAAEVLFLGGLGILLMALIVRGGPLTSAIIGVLAVGAAWGGSWYAFTVRHLLLDPLLPSMAVVSVFLACSVPRAIWTEGERRWIRRAFSSYISPNLVEHLIEHPNDLRLGGERRECTFVMTDLAGFTSLVEKLDPESVIGLLNEYLEHMVAIALEHEGTLDRIVGDAVAVMFSAPVVQPDHAARGVACAQAMDSFAREFAAAKQREGIPLMGTRIGVHSGPVIVGNVGGPSLVDYRALGDAVNTAARLETVNRQLGTRICVSGVTASACSAFIGRPVGVLVLKGKTEGVAAFEPRSEDEMRSAQMVAYLAAYRLLEKNDPGAREAFTEIADDPLAAFHLRRIERGERGVVVSLAEK